MKVFIASRFGEFREIRKKLVEDLPIANFQPVDLNDNMAVAQSPIERSLKSLKETKVVILLIGDTYGTIPSGYQKSYTHLEYEEAKNARIKIFAYFIGHSYKDDEIKYSDDVKLREMQEDIVEKYTYSLYSNKVDTEYLVNNIITSIYEGMNRVWLDQDTGLMWQVKVDHWENNGKVFMV